MRLAITIATRNRRPEVERTCAALARLDPQPDELWICADGCEDDTVDWVRRNCPQARLIVHPVSHHSIRSRDEMIRATSCDIVVGLDDDSYPVDANFVSEVKARFSTWPRCAVLSFPQRTDEFPPTLSQTDFGPPLIAGTYVNAASAMRRGVYLELGGWPLVFEHAADEPDYALRCIAAGWQVIHETSLVVRHHWSALMRNEVRVHHRHARNELWSVLLRCPSPWWPLVAAVRAAGQFRYACRRGGSWVMREPRWWWQALCGSPKIWRQRNPVDWTSYRRWRKLVRQPETILKNSPVVKLTMGILMVVSPGEGDVGADSLRRALKKAPVGCRVFLVNNGALVDPLEWWQALGCEEHALQVITPPAAPQAYFEIGRTVFSALREIAASPPDILFKIDPDTLVIAPEFFSDVMTLDAEQSADFYACHVRTSPKNQFKRCARLGADLLPIGVGRQPGMTRYGRCFRPRFRPAWYWRPGATALCRATLCSSLQPSGGFYALRGKVIVKLAARGFLGTQGAVGLEWNDDTLLPIAVRAAGGTILDIRSSRFATGWRWLHGSRYFSNEEATEPGLRALHPVKLDVQDRALRNRI